MDNQMFASFEIPTKDDELDLPSLYNVVSLLMCFPIIYKR
jgi:hypothetical protein